MKNCSKNYRKMLMIVLAWTLLLAGNPMHAQARVKLSANYKILTPGKLFYLKVKNTKKKVRWRSNNKNVAVVRAISRKKAVVRANSPGETWILAKAGSKILKCKIVVKSNNKKPTGQKSTTEMKDVTPKETKGSDLKLLHSVTKLDFPRWIQSFTMDKKYYYFIQMSSAYTGNLRITRVKYAGLGRYTKDHMDLINFGHGTNLDCSTYKGVTYLWTGSGAEAGSDVSRSISCFPYIKNGRIYNHSAITYKIPFFKHGAYVSNVYPAVNEKGNRLLVRFTKNGKQYYQSYKLSKGTKINTSKLLTRKICPLPAADFQGFDYYKGKIKTIEGSPSKIFLAGYDKSRIFYPTVIRTYKPGTSKVSRRTITGASRLTFREPEGIKVNKKGETIIMFVSNTLTDQSCNIYKVR